MANIGTSLAGLADFAGDFLSGTTSFLNQVTPIVQTGLQVAGAFGEGPLAQPKIRMRSGNLAAPGGAPIAQPAFAQFPSRQVGVPGGAAAVANMATGLLGPLLPDVGVPGPGVFSPSPSAGLQPSVVGSHLRYPSTWTVPHATRAGEFVTYVKAPKVRYKVTAHGPKRRCSGGR